MEYRGKMYYFCAVGCKERFEENPEKFLARLEEEPEGRRGLAGTKG